MSFTTTIDRQSSATPDGSNSDSRGSTTRMADVVRRLGVVGMTMEDWIRAFRLLCTEAAIKSTCTAANLCHVVICVYCFRSNKVLHDANEQEM
mmetsp:Transcript_23592/g.34915  ORF Transcript_23592/g.34915 Transcript_23592/m.34915 type:complete len:93 (+) Transcript_23592:173-451(+)